MNKSNLRACSCESSFNNFSSVLYFESFYKVRNYILSHGGSYHEAEDIFHDAICVYLEQVIYIDKIPQKFIPFYLIRVCRNLWTKYQRNKFRIIYVEHISDYGEEKNNDFYDIHQHWLIKCKCLFDAIELLDKESKDIILRILNCQGYREIANDLGYKNTTYIRVKKYRIKKRLQGLIKKTKLYPQLQEIEHICCCE
ncbi:MAG: RNA polymerase sigma factor [Bacteroidales bacterium]